MWVAKRTPAAIALRPCSKSAPVWPAATTMPARCSRSIAASAPGSSGASVIRRGLAASTASTFRAVGSARWARRWAPRNEGLRNGPSMWAPSTRAPVASAAAPTVAANSAPTSTGSEMIVGRNAVTPVAGSACEMAAIESAPAAASWPANPFTWRSTNPGAISSPGPAVSSSSAFSGGLLRPTQVMTSPSTRIESADPAPWSAPRSSVLMPAAPRRAPHARRRPRRRGGASPPRRSPRQGRRRSGPPARGDANRGVTRTERGAPRGVLAEDAVVLLARLERCVRLDRALGDAERGRALGRVHGRDQPAGAGAEVVEPAARAQAVGDGLDGAGDVWEVWGDRIHRVRVLVVHEADEVEGPEGVELVGARVDFLAHLAVIRSAAASAHTRAEPWVAM